MDTIIEFWQEEKVKRVGEHKENPKNAISQGHRLENLKKVRLISSLKKIREIQEDKIGIMFVGLAVRKYY